MLFMMRIYSKKQFFGILLLLCNKVKKIFLYGNYAAVSIGRDKIHVHRLIGLYLIGRRRCNNHFHHINSNKMDNRSVNIACVEPQIHISRHNKGRKPSTNAIRQTIAANHRRKGYRTNPHRGDVTPEQVYNASNRPEIGSAAQTNPTDTTWCMILFAPDAGGYIELSSNPELAAHNSCMTVGL